MDEDKDGGPEVPREPTPAGQASVDPWIAVVYEELRAMAGKLLSDKAAAVTLAPTSLVHEAYLRLLDQRRTDWHDRLHFFRIAAQVMRRVLVDHCRTRAAQKRGGAFLALDLEEAAHVAAPARDWEVLEIDRLLSQLETLDLQQARVVELRFFGGLTLDETAQALSISKATVKRDWTVARAWLLRELARAPSGNEAP